MRVLLFCLASSFLTGEQPSYKEGIGYVVLKTSIPEEKRRARVIDKKPIKIIDNELFNDWLETLFLNDWISDNY